MNFIFEYFTNRRIAAVHLYEMLRVFINITMCPTIVALAVLYVIRENYLYFLIAFIMAVGSVIICISVDCMIQYYNQIHLYKNEEDNMWIFVYPQGHTLYEVLIPIKNVIGVVKHLDNYLITGEFLEECQDTGHSRLISKITVPDVLNTSKEFYEDLESSLNK